MEDGELHVLSFDEGTQEEGGGAGPGLAGGWGTRREEAGPGWLRALLGRLLGRPAEEVPLVRDQYGRPRLEGLPIGLCVCRDDGRLIVALAHRMTVAVSAHCVPEVFSGAAFLPFTPRERQVVDSVQEPQQPWLLARLWARKEAALRLWGPGRLSLADEVNALPGGRGGAVLVPGPVPGSGHALRRAYVVDLPTAVPDRVVSAATSGPLRTVRTWQAGCTAPEAVMA
ncbi:4'-phosphopantetheinyl transferase superfamily protein [Streptomyces sp. XH2]|uniref:4'-phosphopantetheinyl transferase superfamily protein n=1 Tax=Streptomyces sp. XH2 TaxID=3412483 RepID=UPI003C7C3DA7